MGKSMKLKWFVDTKWSVWLLMLPVAILLMLILEYHVGYNLPTDKTPSAQTPAHTGKPIKD